MDLNDFFDVLAEAERRRVLEQLVETGATSHVGLLKDRCEVSATLLQQVHLPKMDRAGLVDYDPQTGDVALTDGGAEVKQFVEAVGEIQAPSDLPSSQAF